MNFTRKRVLVTGAGKGIGRAIVLALAKAEAEVFAISRTESDLESLEQLHPNNIRTKAMDITSWNECRRYVESILPINMLVNNAGINSLSSFLELTENEIIHLITGNVTHMVNISQVVAKDLISRNEPGSIVNVSSVASMTSLKDHTAYSMSKGAVDQLTKSMALELGGQNIRVNAVNPTVVMTAMGKMAWSKPEKAGPMLNRIPRGKFLEEDEVVNTVLFLLSDKSSGIHGSLIPIDVGLLL